MKPRIRDYGNSDIKRFGKETSKKFKRTQQISSDVNSILTKQDKISNKKDLEEKAEEAEKPPRIPDLDAAYQKPYQLNYFTLSLKKFPNLSFCKAP